MRTASACAPEKGVAGRRSMQIVPMSNTLSKERTWLQMRLAGSGRACVDSIFASIEINDACTSNANPAVCFSSNPTILHLTHQTRATFCLPHLALQKRYLYDTHSVRPFARESGCDQVMFSREQLRCSTYVLLSIHNCEQLMIKRSQFAERWHHVV